MLPINEYIKKHHEQFIKEIKKNPFFNIVSFTSEDFEGNTNQKEIKSPWDHYSNQGEITSDFTLKD